MDITLRTQLSRKEVATRLVKAVSKDSDVNTAKLPPLFRGYPPISAVVEGNRFRLAKARRSDRRLVPIFYGEMAAEEGGGTTITGNFVLRKRVRTHIALWVGVWGFVIWMTTHSTGKGNQSPWFTVLYSVIILLIAASGWLAMKREEENVKRFLIERLDSAIV